MTRKPIHNLVTELDKQMETSSAQNLYELIIVAVVLSMVPVSLASFRSVANSRISHVEVTVPAHRITEDNLSEAHNGNVEIPPIGQYIGKGEHLGRSVSHQD
ncbi:hypothetical protein OUZ56_018640 [Daphnia magna]|uniref:Uncharacterized protein n=1 Tax=Daphnia magna TaxID=35525 RepID=A0ABQ9Z9I6_9CRUS|nr:hypothetical protein OUZ56_018640 [Daphnia magna]